MNANPIQTGPALLQELVRFVKTAGAKVPLANLPEAEIANYLAHHAAHGTLSWCRTVQAFGLLTVWPVSEDWLRWCPDEPVVGAWPDWTADALYIGEVILTGGATSQARQLEVLVRSLAARQPEAVKKKWFCHRGRQLMDFNRWKRILG